MAMARVTVVQFSNDADDSRSNLEAMKEDVRAHAESDLVVFPELTLHGHEVSAAPPSEIRRALRGTSEDEIREFDRLVGEVGTRVVYGKVVETGGQLHNLATYTDGRRRVSYAKTHVHWSEGFQPGRDFPVVKDFLVPLGMLICFDAAFPEVPRILALRGAQVIVNISAIPESFPLKYVHRRLVACSLENQVYTVFANRAGGGFRGGSMVVDPRGEIVARAEGEERFLTVDVDLGEVRRWREEEPLFAHRRPDLYYDITSGADTPK